MSKPTKEQLEKVNKFTRVEKTEDDIYVFPDMMIDNAVTSYYTIVHENLLRKFNTDVKRGVGLLLVHDSNKLPVGRSFDATLVEEWDEKTGDTLKSLYGDFYIDLGRNTGSDMTTDDLAKGIDSGTIFDTSIGFNAKSMKCSICGEDIRSWNCSHYPGKEYIVENDEGVGETKTCYAIIGEDGKGELIENSLVYAGACNRATIINEYSRANDNVMSNMPKLQLVKELKDLPLDANVYLFYTAGELVIMTDRLENDKRSESRMDKYKEVLDEFKIQSEDELELKLTELNSKAAELENKNIELSNKMGEIEKLNKEITQLKTGATAKDEEISKLNKSVSDLTKSNEELKANEELIETYKKDLKDETIELGIRSQGNAFNKTLFEKFLDTLSIAELKEVKEGFNTEVINKFSKTRTTQPKDKTKKKADGEMYKDDFETDEEYTDYIAGLALEYSKKNNVSIIDATKLMHKKYLKRGDE